MTASAVWQGSNLTNIKTPPSIPIGNSPQISPKVTQQPKAKSRNNSKSNNSHHSSVIKEPQSRNKSNQSHHNGPPGLLKNESNQNADSKNGIHSKENYEGTKRNNNNNGNHNGGNNAWNSNTPNENVKKPRENSNYSNEHSTSQKSSQERGNKSESIAIPTNKSRSNSKSTPYLHPNHPDRSQSGTTPPLSNSLELNRENDHPVVSVPKETPSSHQNQQQQQQPKENHQKNHKKGKGNQSNSNAQQSSQPTHHSQNPYVHHNNNNNRNGGNIQPNNEWIHPIIEKIPDSNCKELSPHPEIFDLEGARGTLSGEQISRLKLLLDEECNIVSKDKTLKIASVTPFKLISKLISRLAMSEIFVLDAGIRLVGSGAAHVLVEPQSSIDVPKEDLKGGVPPPFIESSHLINDIDFCFYIPEGTEFYKILQIQEHVIIEFLEETQNPRKYSLRDIYTQFFLDSVKVESESPREGWSLITIGEQGQRTIDIKFVIKSKRSWVFSADSFEIILDPFFQKVVTCYKSVIKYNRRTQWMEALREAASFYKSAEESVSNEEIIKVESLYADYIEAFEHLKNKQLYTKRPEEIRRGIFRYCHELAKGKSPNDSERTKLDKIFVDSFLGEKTPNFDFEEVLKKFLVKHISSSLLCLIQLHDIFVRAGYDSYSETQYYMDIIKKKKEEYESIGLHQPVPILASHHESKSISSTKL
eukprot:TRINITY_DN4826_c0_g1_i1.p2 TRINITY_DN4826_c0_g1~~TRINITY_DN4826_c0_g1_i1.p2  ORF type:complete len:701 (+),score=316.42 TRINITY_DN4826_c0_g1_i1:765-2867(+)